MKLWIAVALAWVASVSHAEWRDHVKGQGAGPQGGELSYQRPGAEDEADRAPASDAPVVAEGVEEVVETLEGVPKELEALDGTRQNQFRGLFSNGGSGGEQPKSGQSAFTSPF